MFRPLFTAFLLLSVSVSLAQNQPPQISNLSVTSDTAAKKIHITFDLSDAESDDVEISVGLSDNDGETFLADFSNPTGDVGTGITPGSGKHIEISYDPGITSISNYLVRVVADDGEIVDIANLVAQVDSTRMFNDLTFLASGTRHYQTGTAHLEASKDTIESRFTGAGLQVSRQDFTMNGVSYTGQNIIGRLPGVKNEAVTYIIDAHFDGVDDTPGADDNGSGVVGVLEAMRVLSQYQFEHSIKFVGFDFEETTPPVFGLNGSGVYVYQPGGIDSYENLEGVFNFEMIGYYTEAPNSQQIPTGFDAAFPAQYAIVEADSFRGNFVVNAANTTSSDIMSVYDSMAAAYVPELKVISIALPFNGIVAPDFRRSDHAVFWDAGYKALMLTDGSNFRNHNYHTPADTVGTLNFTFMSNITKATVAAVAELAKVTHSTFAVQQVDAPVQVTEAGDECNLNVSLNGQGKYLFISSSCILQPESTLQLYDAAGRLATAYSIDPGTLRVTLPNNLAPGVYVAVISDNQRQAAKRFIVIE